MEIRRSYNRLISTMGYPIVVRQHIYIESGPWSLGMGIHHPLVDSPNEQAVVPNVDGSSLRWKAFEQTVQWLTWETSCDVTPIVSSFQLIFSNNMRFHCITDNDNQATGCEFCNISHIYCYENLCGFPWHLVRGLSWWQVEFLSYSSKHHCSGQFFMSNLMSPVWQ